jgi:hypothetical protein
VPGEDSNAISINDSGLTVGWANGHAVAWTSASAASVVPLVELAGSAGSTAGAVNADGRITGICTGASGVQTAVVWPGYRQPPVALQPLAGQTNHKACGISTDGRVAGWAATNGVYRAVVWESVSAPATALPVLRGTTTCTVSSINGSGVVVGQVRTKTSLVAAIWKKSTSGTWSCTDLNTLAGAAGLRNALSINSSGWILCEGSAGSYILKPTT